MKHAYLPLLLLLACSLIQGGCASHQPTLDDTSYYQPLNTIQQEFYDIQTMYESGKFVETISLGEVFLSKYARDILSVAVHYYMAASYQNTGKKEEAKALFEQILKTHPDDEWGKLAQVGLEELASS